MSNKARGKFSKKSAYLIGLSTVIVLTLFNQFLIQRILSVQKFDATVINLAGRQRMLSQKITKEALLIVQQEASLDSLKKHTLQWGKVHEGLQKGDAELGLPELESEPAEALFNRLSPFQQVVEDAILSADSEEELAQNLMVILENEQQFLLIMDEIVNTLESESNERVRRLIYLEMFLAFFSIVVLAGEFLFIFKPIYIELEDENEELEKTIKELSHSKGELFKSTQRFDLSIEAINAGIWDWYIPDGTEWWSVKFYDLLGYKPKEIPATYDTFLYKLVHPEDREKVEKAVKAHLENRTPYKLEIRMKTKDGYYRWFETVGQASWDFKGEPIRMVGSIIDIEEKKQFESQLFSDEQSLRIQKEELEKALSELSEIQKVAKIGTWEVDLKAMTAHWSDEVYKIHEVPVGVEIKVEEGINYYREDYRPIIQKAIDNAIEKNEPWNEECVLVTGLGNEIWVRAVGFPVFKDNSLIALRGLFMDITEERQKNMERLENATKLSLLLDTSETGIWEWDLNTQELEWDDQMFRIYDIEKNEFTNTYESYSNALVEEDLIRIEKELEEAIKGRYLFDSEFRIKKKNGSLANILVKGKVLEDDSGNAIKMIGLNLDITDRLKHKANEERRERFAELLQILPKPNQTESEKIRGMLEVVAKSIGMETGLVSRIKPVNNLYTIIESYTKESEIPVGTNFDLDTTYDHITLSSKKDLIAIHSMGSSEYKDHPCYTTFNNEAYIGTTIYNGSEPFGMLSFVSSKEVDPFSDEDKELIKSVAASTSHLITIQHDKQRAEEEKREQKLIFQSIFDNTFNFTGLLEPDGTLIEANKSALNFGGFTIEDARGLNFADAPWWSLSEEINQQLRDAILKAASGEFIRYDVDVVGVGGKVITIDFSISPIFDDDGDVIYLVPEGRDISEKYKLNEQLELSERQLKTFINQAPVAVAMLDNKMNYIAVSNKWYKEYGIQESNIIGKCHYDIFPEIRSNKIWLDDHRKVLSGKELSSDKDKFVREDGSVQWLSWKLLPWYLEKNEVGGMIMYTSDITNQIKYSEQLENLNEILEHQVQLRTEELNKANSELEAFSYSVSHDLRAPLRSINGFADILEEDYRDSLDEEGRRLIGIIKESGIKMGQLIDDILEFSRLGRKELKKGKVYMEEVFKEVKKEVTYQNKDLNIKFEMGQLLDVKGDLSLLKQVVTNLISNAVKYSSKEEIIKIEVSSIEKEDTIIFRIKDNGAGFEMKYHDKLFGVFQRLHSSNEFKGTGVGLAIVRRILNKHGGEIWAESELSKGSIFYFSLPKN